LIRRVLFLILACLLVTTASAEDRNTKIRALMEAQGLLATMQEQLTSGHERGRAMANQMMQNALKGLVPDESTKDKMTKAASQFIDEMQSPITAADIVAIWSEAYGSKFSDAELDGLLTYYQSPLAQKEVQVSRLALTVLSERVQAAYKPVMDAAVARYVERIKAIVGDCHCAKQ
jgi:type II secretory pathway pseudopilin PulG